MPASGDVLLDTSVVIPYFKGDQAVHTQIQASAKIHLPQTVLGELICGAHLSNNPARTLAEVQNFLKAVVVISPGCHNGGTLLAASVPTWPKLARRYPKTTFGLPLWPSSTNSLWRQETLILTASTACRCSNGKRFVTVNPDLGCVEWPGGVDLCPDAMHQVMTGSESQAELHSAGALHEDAKKSH